ncbi:hypothetical protein M409DRAFT_23304 [Zasmidium cellare ATCC 36951]|uniref:Major facilitator superfamily (MFS) profile domain-containing protein n=1 Tax=Zasmidium cellare ATCC 36951 TaxID=1080233 RepID=A0A6A6CJ92_ZASCE|nr:uncharacterized protein M409DRAFT_23304 [Zasmidium cellare ATCC 36951]KAF2166673.1 hypothetical protein M409DRAFT_23304 [Zasmidium cellare ATCC 36951]
MATLASMNEKTPKDPANTSIDAVSVENGHLDVQTSDKSLDRRLLLKRDLVLLPSVGLLYMIMFLDRTNIANAKIEGLVQGLNMPSNGYSTALWIFYIPFILAEVPSNLILNQGKIPPNYFLGGMTCVLGILGMCQGLTASYGGLLALRFLMGALEAALPAGAAYMISIYYTKKEAAVRFAAFFNFALLGPFFSGLLAYAIVNLDGTGGYEGWQWIFIIEGLMTVFFGLIALIFTPNFPKKAQHWFLKPNEREYLIAKLEASRGLEEKGSVADDVSIWKVLVDWRIHLFTLCFFCCDITASSISAFMTSILKELGWTSSRAQVMTMPVWGSGIFFTFLVTWTASRVNFRAPFILASTCSQLVGWAIMVAYVPAPGVRYAALFFMSIGTFPQMPLLMTWLSNNLRGRKYLAVGMAWQVGFGNRANFVSSNVFITGQAPRYRTGFANGLGWTCSGFALVCFTTLLLSIKNKRRADRVSRLSVEERAPEEQKSFKFLL